MKKIFSIAFALFILFCAAIAFADEVDDQLPNTAPDKLKASTRQMIRVGINSDEAINLTRAMLQNRFELVHILKAQRILINALKKGLPLKPLFNKAFEGMTKHVKAINIVQAMQNVQARYAFAYLQAGILTTEPEQRGRLGDTMAASLAAGLNAADAKEIINLLQERAQKIKRAQLNELAFETLTATRDMARLGVPSKMATGVVKLSLQKGYSHNDMKAMRHSFMANSRHTSPKSLAKIYADAIQLGSSPQRLEGLGDSPSGASTGSGGQGGSGGSGEHGGHR